VGAKSPSSCRAIILIGLPGAGKTSVGEILAKKLCCPFFDSDRLIEDKEKRSVSCIFKDDGEERFREMETALLEQFPDGLCVFSCGGGLPMTAGNMDRLLDLGHVVFLKTTIEELMTRLSAAHDRPLLKSDPNQAGAPDEHVLRNRLTTLESDRSLVYERAQHTVPTDGLTTEAVAQKILHRVNEEQEAINR